MRWRKRFSKAALAALALGCAATAASAQKQYGPGVTDTEIKIGTTTPYSGPASAYAAGAVWNNPIRRNRSDQLGLAVGWNKTNHSFTGTSGVRDGEWVTELFYKATIFKGMHITPDVQVFWNPAFAPNAGPEAVFTVRTTVSF